MKHSIRFLAAALALLLCASPSATAVEIETPNVDASMHDKPKPRQIPLEGQSSRVYMDIPYCGENSTETQKLHILLPDEGEGPYRVHRKHHTRCGIQRLCLRCGGCRILRCDRGMLHLCGGNGPRCGWHDCGCRKFHSPVGGHRSESAPNLSRVFLCGCFRASCIPFLCGSL